MIKIECDNCGSRIGDEELIWAVTLIDSKVKRTKTKYLCEYCADTYSLGNVSGMDNEHWRDNE